MSKATMQVYKLSDTEESMRNLNETTEFFFTERLTEITIGVSDWVSFRGFGRGMRREYFLDLRIEYGVPSVFTRGHVQWTRPFFRNFSELSWGQVISFVRAHHLRGKLDDQKTLYLIRNGGYSDRICREVTAILPRRDLQGQGVGR